MKRRIIAIVLTILLAFSAHAESTYLGTMMVDNCDEWVSLRDGPGTGCARLAKVPLFAIVTDAEQGPLTGDFIYCNYDDQWGYILAKYLVPWADPEPEGSVELDETLNGYHVKAEKAYVGDGEYMLVTCEDEQEKQLWFFESSTSYVTELGLISAFIGGPAQDPMVMVYNSEKGLSALDIVSGEVRWTLTDAELGGGISHAVDGEGNTYIGGYYGPDPVCIDANGKVKWRSDSQGCYWLYRMEIAGDELVCTYDVLDGDHDRQGEVVFGLDGALLSKTEVPRDE